ncbi:hypothetical protein ACQPT4_00105, partial [Erwinia amylovora]
MLKPKALYSLALLLLLNGCQTGKPRTPQETGEMPYGKWRFAFFTPHALPAVVTRAMIIDSEYSAFGFSIFSRPYCTPC